MQVNLGRNHFELFGLEPGFEIDLSRLSTQYRELQKNLHPDRFANATAQERRLSVQLASQINDGYRILSKPILRGRYMLELAGVVFDDALDTQMDPAFLMEQMELREQLEILRSDDNPLGGLAEMSKKLGKQELEKINKLKTLLEEDSGKARGRAKSVLKELQFLQKLGYEIEAIEEELT